MNLNELLFGPKSLLRAGSVVEPKYKQKNIVVLPLQLIGKDVILTIRHQYFNGVTLEAIAAETDLGVEEVENVIDAMNL